VIYEVKIAVFAIQNCLPKGLGLQCRVKYLFTAKTTHATKVPQKKKSQRKQAQYVHDTRSQKFSKSIIFSEAADLTCQKILQ
jgi:hypothetical protein